MIKITTPCCQFPNLWGQDKGITWPNPQNYRWQNGKVRLLFISKEHCCATMKNLLADGRGGWVADGRLCRSRVAAKCSQKFKFRVSWNFPPILWNSKKILSQFCVLQNFDNAVSQPPYVGVEWGGGGLVQPWRTLRANADCPLFVFPLYCFPFCHL